MNRRLILILTLAAALLLPAARTGAAGAVNPAAAGQEVGLTSDHMTYDGIRRQLIYYDDVVVTNVQGRLTCARLTIDLPPEGSLERQPTNAVAETNVAVDFIRQGDTNHITCARAVYAYQVRPGATNDTITFLGSAGQPARVQNSRGWMTGEPLVWDNVNGNFSGANTETHFSLPTAATTTNAPAPPPGTAK